MRRITLVQGEKDSGKSKFIHKKFKEIESEVEVIEIVNEGDWNTEIYIVRNKKSNDIIILNSGSDMRCIISSFGAVLSKYPTVSSIFTAIRPYNKNPKLHIWMKLELNITEQDEVTTIDLDELEH
ncbi:hypothetical protein [Bacteroides acidifaciens]|uniref:hypothetical protein n=1 Tax=Bacteroides acidifaciens TaxID=85831 RepID=UPI00158CC11B|nr:hypothetical protein [Bacteroides acidifaciens]